jgi:hypothetical protein
MIAQVSSIKIGVERCLNCGHKWIDYSQSREFCYMCGRKGYSETLSLSDIKNAITGLRQEDKKYLDKHTKRASVLKQRYRETTDLYLNRAKEIFSKVQQIYSHGEMSERLIDQLIFCFRLYSEVGLNKSAASCAYMTATAYTQRGIEKEVQAVDDLADLIAARQWFMRLEAKDWEMAINLHVGEKAMATISTEPALLQTMMQIALWHFYQARNFYFEKKSNQLVERIQFDIDQTTKLLSSYTRGLSEIEAAKITAAGNESQGAEIRKGLESLGSNVGYGLESLGEHIEKFGGSLNRAIQGSVGMISASVSHSAYALSSAMGRPSKILKDSVIDIGRMITASVQSVPADVSRPINELGTKLAKSTANKGLLRKVVSDNSFQNMANSVLPTTDSAINSLGNLDQPSEHSPDSLMDTMVMEGMDSVLYQIEKRKIHPN